MDNRQRPQKSIISTGTTSIVLIFVMLSLLTFAVLSLVSAQANLRLSRKSAERTTAYYEAENAANDILAGLLAGEDPASLQADVRMDGSRASYEVPLGEDQVLAVEVDLPVDGQPFQVVRWQAVSQYDWNADEPMNLMGTGGLPAGFGGSGLPAGFEQED